MGQYLDGCVAEAIGRLRPPPVLAPRAIFPALARALAGVP